MVVGDDIKVISILATSFFFFCGNIYPHFASGKFVYTINKMHM